MLAKIFLKGLYTLIYADEFVISLLAAIAFSVGLLNSLIYTFALS